MSAILLAPLNDLQALSLALFQSLSPPTTKPPPPPPVSAFLACDQALASAIALAHTHQIKQRKIEALKAEILELDMQWRQICLDLENEKSELQEMIDEGEKRMDAIEAAKKGAAARFILHCFHICSSVYLLYSAAIPYPELLAYAQSLSAFTSAPPNMPEMIPNQPPPPLFFPPFPNEEKMRRGRLNAEAPLGILGETHSVGRAPTASPEADDARNDPHRPYHRDMRGPQATFFDLDLDLNPDM
jgi:mediator of RNA polymerase II transcription subunit 4